MISITSLTMDKCKQLVKEHEREKSSLRKSIDNLAKLLGTADHCPRCDDYRKDVDHTLLQAQATNTQQTALNSFHFELMEKTSTRR